MRKSSSSIQYKAFLRCRTQPRRMARATPKMAKPTLAGERSQDQAPDGLAEPSASGELDNASDTAGMAGPFIKRQLLGARCAIRDVTSRELSSIGSRGEPPERPKTSGF